MNKTVIRTTFHESYDAICDKCGATIATDCHSFNDVAQKAPVGTNFNGDGNYICPKCSNGGKQ